jgi:hypothetical protein
MKPIKAWVAKNDAGVILRDHYGMPILFKKRTDIVAWGIVAKSYRPFRVTIRVEG